MKLNSDIYVFESFQNKYILQQEKLSISQYSRVTQVKSNHVFLLSFTKPIQYQPDLDLTYPLNKPRLYNAFTPGFLIEKLGLVGVCFGSIRNLLWVYSRFAIGILFEH